MYHIKAYFLVQSSTFRWTVLWILIWCVLLDGLHCKLKYRYPKCSYLIRKQRVFTKHFLQCYRMYRLVKLYRWSTAFGTGSDLSMIWKYQNMRNHLHFLETVLWSGGLGWPHGGARGEFIFRVKTEIDIFARYKFFKERQIKLDFKNFLF